ncbi:MAG: winged helix-turn-helix domain-containing protein [Chloroflexi bacterium]|nr:winged helix-turn-helix domain-containing protein [Chloroflexota bacterium]
MSENGSPAARREAIFSEAPHTPPGRWDSYPPSYRAREIQTILAWVSRGDSGSVVGLPGSGRSTLLEFLCHRPDVHIHYLGLDRNVVFVPVDLNILPDNTVATLYRVILRAFYHGRHQFIPALQQNITTLYHKNKGARDPFLPQSALLELLELFRVRQARVACVLNRFDEFCQVAEPELVRTLRGLRDTFKGTLCYLAGMHQEVEHLSDLPALQPLAEILDMNVCWVGPLNGTDGRQMIERQLRAAASPPGPADAEWLWQLTGGHPSLIRLACNWWLATPARPPHQEWADLLLAQTEVQPRLGRMLDSLTQKEQLALSELQKVQAQLAAAQVGGDTNAIKKRKKEVAQTEQEHHESYASLHTKGICRSASGGWQIFSLLFQGYVASVVGRGRGGIWLDHNTGELYQGKVVLSGLAPLEKSVLSFFVQHPRRQHTHNDIIEAAWPDDVQLEGVSTETLYQVIRGLRKKIEPNPGKPVYIINWRGQRKGGYQFFPEGRPA